jgi:hypothetical protein
LWNDFTCDNIAQTEPEWIIPLTGRVHSQSIILQNDHFAVAPKTNDGVCASFSSYRFTWMVRGQGSNKHCDDLHQQLDCPD